MKLSRVLIGTCQSRVVDFFKANLKTHLLKPSWQLPGHGWEEAFTIAYPGHSCSEARIIENIRPNRVSLTMLVEVQEKHCPSFRTPGQRAAMQPREQQEPGDA